MNQEPEKQTPRPIDAESNELAMAIESLQRNVDTLLERINSILTPSAGERLVGSAPSPTPVAPASPFAEGLRGTTINIRKIAREVIQATNRLEL